MPSMPCPQLSAFLAALSLFASPLLAAPDAPDAPGAPDASKLAKPAQVAADIVPESDDLSAEIESLIDQLGSSDFATRQRATEQLLGNDALPLAALERVIASRALSAEARARLLQVARQAFYKSPRAALGVQFDNVNGLRALRDRVVVGQTFKEFPSHRILEPGDIIDQAAGIKLRGPTAQLILPAIIVSHDPGQILALVIRRGNQLLKLDVPLGNFSDLQQAGGGIPPDDRISRAWRVRAARIFAPAEAPIRAGVAPAQWSPSSLNRDDPAVGLIRNLAAEPAPRVAGGGMPRNAADLEQEQTLIQRMVFVNGQQRIIQDLRPRQFVEEIEPSGPSMTQEQELIELARARTQVREQLRQLGSFESLPEADPLRARAELVKRTITALDRQSAAIQAEMAEERRNEPADDAHPQSP